MLGVDTFVQGNKYYLSVVDCYSKYPYVSQFVAFLLRKWFLPWGSVFQWLALQKKSSVTTVPSLPAKSTANLLTSGNSPWLQSSLHYPRVHGFTERQVQIIKKLFNKSDEDGTNPLVALQELWATPCDSNTPSVAELLHSIQMNTSLPAIIKPPQNSEVVRESLQSRQDFYRYDAQAKKKSNLLPTQPV